jgi:hypothetical protein
VERVKCLNAVGRTSRVRITGLETGEQLLMGGVLEGVIDELVRRAIVEHPTATHAGVTVKSDADPSATVWTSFTKRFVHLGWSTVLDIERSAMSENTTFVLDASNVTVSVTTVEAPTYAGGGGGFPGYTVGAIRQRENGTVLVLGDSKCLFR